MLGLVAVPLVLAGCAGCAGQPAAAPVAATTAASSSDAAAQYASATPPAAAQMVCSDDIRGRVAAALNLASIPAPRSTWADHVYTCTYQLPMGQLVLSVTVAPSNSAARDHLETLRGQLAATNPEPGLGEQAYGSPAGTIIAVKDNMVLSVDATHLPDDLGATHERRIDLARVIASGVFNCWTGNG